MKPMTVKEFFEKYPSDDACLQRIMDLRYGTKGVNCPSCAMKTNFYRTKSLRAYTCQRCGYHLYPCVGTPFQNSRTSLQFWFYAMYLFSQTRSGVSAKELQRKLGVTYKCAWRMGHKIREYMLKLESTIPLNGTIEGDEAYRILRIGS